MISMWKFLLISFLVTLGVHAANEAHRVEALPGNKPFRSKWYSGSYNVSSSRHLHYFFVESLNKPETDPVIIYFNGGPGVSSTVMAFIGMGPVITAGTGTLYDFDSSWCKNASVIFLDNPAGVGFSYAGT